MWFPGLLTWLNCVTIQIVKLHESCVYERIIPLLKARLKAYGQEIFGGQKFRGFLKIAGILIVESAS